MLFITWFSERINQRALCGLWAQIWVMPCLIALAVMPANINKWSQYAIVTTLLSYPYRKQIFPF